MDAAVSRAIKHEQDYKKQQHCKEHWEDHKLLKEREKSCVFTGIQYSGILNSFTVVPCLCLQKATCQRTGRHKLLLPKKKLIAGLETQSCPFPVSVAKPQEQR